MPWKPSQPAMKSQASSCSRPSAVEDDLRPVALDIREAQRRRLEADVAAAGEAQRDQILHHLGLAIGRDASPAGELAQGDAMALALHRDLDAMMRPGLRDRAWA